MGGIQDIWCSIQAEQVDGSRYSLMIISVVSLEPNATKDDVKDVPKADPFFPQETWWGGGGWALRGETTSDGIQLTPPSHSCVLYVSRVSRKRRKEQTVPGGHYIRHMTGDILGMRPNFLIFHIRDIRVYFNSRHSSYVSSTAAGKCIIQCVMWGFLQVMRYFLSLHRVACECIRTCFVKIFFLGGKGSFIFLAEVYDWQSESWSKLSTHGDVTTDTWLQNCRLSLH